MTEKEWWDAEREAAAFWRKLKQHKLGAPSLDADRAAGARDALARRDLGFAGLGSKSEAAGVPVFRKSTD